MTTEKRLVIDTETGGLFARKNSLLSIAGVVVEIGKLPGQVKLGAEFEYFVREPDELYCVEPAAMKVNNIDEVWLKTYGDRPFTAYTKLITFIRRHFGEKRVPMLVGYNIEFDTKFLKRLWWLAGETDATYRQTFSYRSVDMAGLVRFMQDANHPQLNTFDRYGPKGGGLGSACKQMGIKTDGAHSALADARMTAYLYKTLLLQQQSLVEPMRNANYEKPGER